MEWIIVALIRLIVPLVILRYQLFGSILAIIADSLDIVILDALGITDFAPYNPFDKALDMYFYLIQGYTIFAWKNTFAKRIGLGLLAYRLIGFIIYEITQMRILLLIFPNVFIFFYMTYLLSTRILKKDPYKKLWMTVVIIIILTALKLGHEYLLHVEQFPIYQFLKSTFFPWI